MKVCILYSGLPRTLIKSINTLSKSLIDVEYHIYIHICINENDNSYLQKKLDMNELTKIKNIRKILLEEPPIIPNKYKTKIEKNIYLQWYKLNKIHSIIDLDENYDIVIRIRPDIFILENNLSAILNSCNNKNILYIPSGNDIINQPKSINDQIAISSIKIMAKYADLINKLDEYKYSNSEIILYKYLEEEGIKVERIDLKYKLVLSMCNIIGITGDSGAGKTTTTTVIEKIFKFDQKLLLETDRYHKWERGDTNWNKITHLNPNANYLEKLQEDTFNLKIGNEIHTVDYDHKTGKFTPHQIIESKNNILLCGLHTLYHDKLRNIIDLKLYIDTDNDLKKFWKIKRDVYERGYSIEKVIESIKKRENDYNKYILPQREFSDIIIKYYTDDKLDDYNTTPKINLKLSIKMILYNIIQKHILDFINNISYSDEYIHLNIKEDITKKDIYKILINNQTNFIDENDIYESYYGVLQLIIALILYK
jgi:uridine kinase